MKASKTVSGDDINVLMHEIESLVGVLQREYEQPLAEEEFRHVLGMTAARIKQVTAKVSELAGS